MTMKPEPAATGRPSSFTDDIANHICGELACGRSLRSICRDDEGMPDTTTVFRWLADERYEAFRDQYDRAREAQADALADEILEIADDGRNDTYIDAKTGAVRVDHDVVNRSRLRVDARKWVAARLKPKKYGDRVGLTTPDGPLELGEAQLGDRLARELARVGEGEGTRPARKNGANGTSR